MSALKPLFLPACADPSGADDDVSAGQSHSLLSLARRPFTGVEGPPSPVPPKPPRRLWQPLPLKERDTEGVRERGREREHSDFPFFRHLLSWTLYNSSNLLSAGVWNNTDHLYRLMVHSLALLLFLLMVCLQTLYNTHRWVCNHRYCNMFFFGFFLVD